MEKEAVPYLEKLRAKIKDIHSYVELNIVLLGLSGTIVATRDMNDFTSLDPSSFKAIKYSLIAAQAVMVASGIGICLRSMQGANARVQYNDLLNSDEVRVTGLMDAMGGVITCADGSITQSNHVRYEEYPEGLGAMLVRFCNWSFQNL